MLVFIYFIYSLIYPLNYLPSQIIIYQEVLTQTKQSINLCFVLCTTLFTVDGGGGENEFLIMNWTLPVCLGKLYARHLLSTLSNDWNLRLKLTDSNLRCSPLACHTYSHTCFAFFIAFFLKYFRVKEIEGMLAVYWGQAMISNV